MAGAYLQPFRSGSRQSGSGGYAPAPAPPSIWIAPARSDPGGLVFPVERPKGSRPAAAAPPLGSELLAAQVAQRAASSLTPDGLALRLVLAYLGHRAGWGIAGIVAGWFAGGMISRRWSP